MTSQYCINFCAPIITTIGLVFDILGAFLVASEVVNKYKGEYQYKRMTTRTGQSEPPEKTDDFTRWENKKNLKMKIGLFLLTVGFILQIIGSWIK